MRTKVAAITALVSLIFGPATLAQQSLNYSLFERYLAAYREQSAIPGLSAVIVQGGRVAWSAGFGVADVEASLPARADTPYPLMGLSQTLGSTLLLQQCVDYGHLDVKDLARRWISDYPDAETTVANLLSHTSPSGSYHYDAGRFAALDEVILQCGSEHYPALLANEVFGRFQMVDAVPGSDILSSSSPAHALFGSGELSHYAGNLQRMALPYRVDDRGRPSRTNVSAVSLDAGNGAVASALDLASFDLALRDGLLLTPDTLRLAWTQQSGAPTGLGWFVQRVGSDSVVWHYGVATDAYSSLIIKVPGRDLTLILLANSDRVSAAYSSGTPDVNASVFAQLFFRIFLG